MVAALLRNPSQGPTAEGDRDSDLEIRGLALDLTGCPTPEVRGVLLMAVARVTVRGCTIIASTSDGIQVAPARGRPDLMSEDVDITGCTVLRSGRNGIALTTGQRVRVCGCRVIGTALHGIDLEPNAGAGTEDVLVSDNFVTGAGHAGIAVDAANQGVTHGGIMIIGNVVRRTGVAYDRNGHGIHLRLAGFREGAIVQGNYIQGAGASGVFVDRVERASVCGNAICDARGYGVWLKSARNGLVLGNQINRCGAAPIQIETSVGAKAVDNVV
jgi:nitrous oxidase accessory protein NosD